MATGLSFSTAVASGESTTGVLTSPLAGSSNTFTWSYQFNANGEHELSNIAIAFCSTDILSHVVSASPGGEVFTTGDVPGGHTGFGPGVKFATTAVNGTLTVVFDQPYAAGGTIQVQSHSGDGASGDLVTTASGPGTCNTTTTTVDPGPTPGPSTTTTVAPTTTTVPPVTTTVPPVTTTVPPVTTTVPPVTTTVPPVTTTVPAVTTTVKPATTTTLPAVSTTVRPTTTTSVATTATVAPTTSTSVPTSVLGARFENADPAARLAKTGFEGGLLVTAGALSILMGAVVLVAARLGPAGD